MEIILDTLPATANSPRIPREVIVLPHNWMHNASSTLIHPCNSKPLSKSQIYSQDICRFTACSMPEFHTFANFLHFGYQVMNLPPPNSLLPRIDIVSVCLSSYCTSCSRRPTASAHLNTHDHYRFIRLDVSPILLLFPIPITTVLSSYRIPSDWPSMKQAR